MNLQKKRYLPQSIKHACGKKGAGQVQWTVGFFFLLFLAAVLCGALQLERYRAVSLYLEDALAASNLASAVIDLEEYGISHRILVENPEAAYGRYQSALRGNLNLDEMWTGREGGLIQGTVKIADYRIYNVGGDEVTVYRYDENGVMTIWQEGIGSAVAPNGVPVESTSVYSELAFTVKGLFGIEIQARKGNLADITR